ncbi:uncharacterized protein LOC131238956 [Magnolia sinica]|uniref:uncharacterized protein LOC131238956 n=1 Tax=Magnolia sinica TaxID=86752 RepID=UPI00265A6C8E|nr:uncharacterized protein LOC131238956 [Magnolia sinica]
MTLIFEANENLTTLAASIEEIHLETRSRDPSAVAGASILAYLSNLREDLKVDPVVYNVLHEDPGNVSYSVVGGLFDQIWELRESIKLPLMNPELFIRVGIKPPKPIVLILEAPAIPVPPPEASATPAYLTIPVGAEHLQQLMQVVIDVLQTRQPVPEMPSQAEQERVSPLLRDSTLQRALLAIFLLQGEAKWTSSQRDRDQRRDRASEARVPSSLAAATVAPATETPTTAETADAEGTDTSPATST